MYTKLSKTALKTKIKRLIISREFAMWDVAGKHVFVSPGNKKTGTIPSVSLLPVLDCGNCGSCDQSCYDLRNDMRYDSIVKTRARNSAIWTRDPYRYFAEISAYLLLNYPRAFRWHIGGDIKNRLYLAGMVGIARKFPDIKFHAFTKMFKLVNAWINEYGEFPENLRIIFSGWLGQEMPNPHNLPTSHPIFPDGTSAPDGTKLCTGNCTECLHKNRLCWSLKKGEAIGFIAH